jgi:hypothetical protein
MALNTLHATQHNASARVHTPYYIVRVFVVSPATGYTLLTAGVMLIKHVSIAECAAPYHRSLSMSHGKEKLNAMRKNCRHQHRQCRKVEHQHTYRHASIH